MAGREVQRVRQLRCIGEPADDGDSQDSPPGRRRSHRSAAGMGFRCRIGAAERVHAGFADIDPRTLAMDPAQILAKITDKTRAVFLTHVQGFDGLTDDLMDELKRRNIPLIEDVCESHGATHNGKKLGSFGWISNFSYLLRPPHEHHRRRHGLHQ